MIISKTPLRASFFGGGTDFEAYFKNSKIGYGSVVSTALDMYVYITVNKKFDDKIRVVYSGNELVDHVDEVKHNIIREALKITGIEKGIEVIYMADIPLSGAGIGLASSSALTVGVLHALYAYKGEFVTPEILARQACEIEINILGQRIGIQDQFAVAYGGLSQYKFYNDGTVGVFPVYAKKETMDSLKDSFLMFYTGTTRDSKRILDEQSDTITDKTAMLDDLTRTADNAIIQLHCDNPDFWGTELDRTWQIKKQFAQGVSNPVIDGMYKKGMDAGALGGKVLGAGGGGFVLFYVPKEKQEAVKTALSDHMCIKMNCCPEGTKIIFCN